MTLEDAADAATFPVLVRRSARRRRTVSARFEAGTLVVAIPAWFSPAEEHEWVEKMRGKMLKRRGGARRSDAVLARRATELSRNHLGGLARPVTVRWVDNQKTRWGSATPAHGTIRISRAVEAMPEFVSDYVLLHELAHLVEPGHGARFWSLLSGYPQLERARGYLEGFAAARGLPASAGEPDEGAADDENAAAAASPSDGEDQNP